MRGSSLRLASVRRTSHEDLREDLATVTVIGTQSKTNAKPISVNESCTVPRKSWRIVRAVLTTKDSKDAKVEIRDEPGPMAFAFVSFVSFVMNWNPEVLEPYSGSNTPVSRFFRTASQSK